VSAPNTRYHDSPLPHLRHVGPATFGRRGAQEDPSMKPPLGRFVEFAYALMRIVTGGLFLFHGLQKVFGMYGGTVQPLMSRPGLAGIIELVCGVLILIGLFTGIAAFIASGEMAVAYFIAHYPSGFWPIQNRGELAALYCFVFLYISARGSGIWSVDRALGRRGA
jgi:putative oxidoreductase